METITKKDTIMMEYSNPNDPWIYDPYQSVSDKERMQIGCMHGFLFLLAALVLIVVIWFCQH